jgi:hypothetical protein
MSFDETKIPAVKVQMDTICSSTAGIFLRKIAALYVFFLLPKR